MENDTYYLTLEKERTNLQLGFKITLQKPGSKVNKVKKDFTVEAKLGLLSPLSLPLNLGCTLNLPFEARVWEA